MTWRTPLIVAAVYAALFCALCFAASHALGATTSRPDWPSYTATCQEDMPCWTWSTMGNKRRGVVDFTGTRRVVGTCQYARLAHRGLLSPRTPHLRGDYLAQRIGCRRH